MSKYSIEARYLILAAAFSALMELIAALGTACGWVELDNIPLTCVLIFLNSLLCRSILKRPEIADNILSHYGTKLLSLAVIGFIVGWVFYETMTMRRIFYANMILIALLPAARALLAFTMPLIKRDWNDKPIARGLLLVMLAIMVLPGFVLPPFWDGIPGWKTGPIDAPQKVSISGYKLVREDGVSVWYSPSILGTVTYFSAWQRHASYTQERLEAYEKFLWRRYVKNYPLLETGRSANQRYLGKYAHPSHTPFRMFDYTKFPPSSIRSLDYVTDTFDVASGKLMESKISQSYKVPQ